MYRLLDVSLHKQIKCLFVVFSLFIFSSSFGFCAEETEVKKVESQEGIEKKGKPEIPVKEKKPVKEEAASAKTEKPQTTITCKGNLDMSYGENMAIFHDHVVVDDPRMKMKADKMKVYFEPESRAIKKVIAIGHVRFKKEDKRAKSHKAVYTASDGKIVLTGKPMVKKGDSIMTGDVITFFRGDSRMIIEPTAKVVFYTGDQKEFEEGWMK